MKTLTKALIGLTTTAGAIAGTTVGIVHATASHHNKNKRSFVSRRYQQYINNLPWDINNNETDTTRPSSIVRPNDRGELKIRSIANSHKYVKVGSTGAAVISSAYSYPGSYGYLELENAGQVWNYNNEISRGIKIATTKTPILYGMPELDGKTINAKMFAQRKSSGLEMQARHTYERFPEKGEMPNQAFGHEAIMEDLTFEYDVPTKAWKVKINKDKSYMNEFSMNAANNIYSEMGPYENNFKTIKGPYNSGLDRRMTPELNNIVPNKDNRLIMMYSHVADEKSWFVILRQQGNDLYMDTYSNNAVADNEESVISYIGQMEIQDKTAQDKIMSIPLEHAQLLIEAQLPSHPIYFKHNDANQVLVNKLFTAVKNNAPYKYIQLNKKYSHKALINLNSINQAFAKMIAEGKTKVTKFEMYGLVSENTSIRDSYADRSDHTSPFVYSPGKVIIDGT